MDPFYSSALSGLLDFFGFGGGTTSVAKNVPPPGGVSTFPKGNYDSIANPDAPVDSLAEAIGPWETTVTPEAATAKTFGDKLADALSGLSGLQSPQTQGPSASDAAAIGQLLLEAAPPTATPSLAKALPRRR